MTPAATSTVAVISSTPPSAARNETQSRSVAISMKIQKASSVSASRQSSRLRSARRARLNSACRASST
jgi:hypothetical protein